MDALVPIPIPSNARQTSNSGHVLAKADPSTGHKQRFPEANIAPLRPRNLFSGPESQQPKNAAAIYGIALIKPTSSRARVDVEAIPKALEKARFAAFAPVDCQSIFEGCE